MPSVGSAHVATASFLASRAVPTGGFAVALAGGVALARAAQRRGLREGWAASLAAMLQTIAIMGPARLNVPLTQAISAPILGRMEARGHGTVAQAFAAAAVRLGHNVPSTAFYVWIIVGLDAYAGSYDQIFGWLPFVPDGTAGALVGTALGLALWTVGASAVQAIVYRCGLRRWAAGEVEVERAAPRRPELAGAAQRAPQTARPSGARFDPRAVVLAAAVAFAVLLTGTAWPLLGAVAAWLGAAWILARGDRSVVRPGLVLTALLASGALVFGVVGGMGIELTLRRTLRAALLVLVATWLRYAAGEDGLREVFRRVLDRVARVPVARATRDTLDGLGTTAQLAASGRRLVARIRALPAARVRGVPVAPAGLVDAILDWTAHEAGHTDPGRRAPAAPLHARRRDAVLVALAVATAFAVPLGA